MAFCVSRGNESSLHSGRSSRDVKELSSNRQTARQEAALLLATGQVIAHKTKTGERQRERDRERERPACREQVEKQMGKWTREGV